MTLGEGLFSSAVFLGLIFLYHSTKDRWNWKKGAKRFGYLVLGLIVLGVGAWLYDEFLHKSSWEITQEKQAKEIAEKERKDQAERPCLAVDVLRMEQVAKKVMDGITMDMALEDVSKIIEQFTETPVSIKPTDEDIKKLVAIGSIPTTCNHDFYFLINATAKLGDKIDTLNMWANNAPKGYTDGHLSEFAVNFFDVRKQAGSFDLSTAKRVLDHCAPDIDKEERLRRLALLGTVRQTTQNVYTIPDTDHRIQFSYSGLQHCK